MKKQLLIVVVLLLFFVPKVSADTYTYLLNGDTPISSNTIWNTGFTYLIQGDVKILPGVTLTIVPGVVVKGALGGSGRLVVQGNLHAVGTPDQPIVFTSYADDEHDGDTNGDATSTVPVRGDWKGIDFEASSTGDIEYSSVLYGGYDQVEGTGGIFVNGGSEMVKHVNIEHSAVAGVVVNAGNANVEDSSITDNGNGITQNGGGLSVVRTSISDNIGTGIAVTAGSSLSLFNNSFSGNIFTGTIQASVPFVHSGNSSQDLHLRGFNMTGILPDGSHITADAVPIIDTYGDLIVAASTTVTIDPGAILKLGGNSDLFIVGKLVAVGTVAEPIRITSIQDPSVGGDTINANYLTVPAPGNWLGIRFAPHSVGSISYTTVDYGGVANSPDFTASEIRNDGGSLSIDHALIRYAGTQGLYQKSGTSTISYSEFTNEPEGIRYREGGLILSNNSFHDLTDQAVYNQSFDSMSGLPDVPHVPVDAALNWWGSADGPHDNSTTTPTGSGSRISANVLYWPWLTADPFIATTSTSTPTAEEGSSTPQQTGTSTPVRIPVIIVPGIMATQLVDNSGGLIWPNFSRIAISASDDFLDLLKLDSSGQSSIENIQTGPVIEGVVGTDYFNGLVNNLLGQGYIEGTDLFIFPYDWRLDIYKTALLLQQKIEQVKSQTSSPKLNIIGHSMGGLVVKSYLKQFGGNSVDTFIDIATPHDGAPSAFKTLMYGDDMGIRYLFGMFNLNQERIKIISQNMPSVYELLPSESYFNSSDRDYASYVWNGVNTNQQLGFLDTKDYLGQNGRNQVLIDRAIDLHHDLDGLDPVVGYGVKTYNIVGCGTPTLGQFYILGNDGNGHTEYDVKMISGDGTVPLRSAEAMHAQKTYYVRNGVHATLPSTAGVKDIVAALASGDDNPAVVPYPDISTNEADCPSLNGQLVSFHSPISLNVYDSSGNHVGPDVSGDIEMNVPGADYEEIDGNSFVYLPAGSTYHIAGDATGSGTFDARVETVTGGQITSTTVFRRVPIRQSSHAAFDIGPDILTVLLLDEDGDGNFEAIAQASLVAQGMVGDTNQMSSVIAVRASAPDVPVPTAVAAIGTGRLFSPAPTAIAATKAASIPVARISLPTSVNLKKIPIQATGSEYSNVLSSDVVHYKNTAVVYKAIVQKIRHLFIVLWRWIKSKL